MPFGKASNLPCQNAGNTNTLTKMKNLKLKIKNFENGFTLIELLVSLLVLISVGVVTVGILTSSLRGATKANVVNNIRQNGSYAIIQMSRVIGYASTFNGVSTDGVNFTTNCLPVPTPTPMQQ